jgi:sporulation protein YlmC with PRC-barrel domain
MMRTSDQADMQTLRDRDLVLASPEDDVRGMGVVDLNGHRLGDVDDLVVDKQHRRARLLVVTSGGILGLAPTQRLIPVDAVTRVDDRVHVDQSRGSNHGDSSPLETGQQANCDLELADAPPPYAEVYADYGVAPFWAMDYITPYFHRR